MIDTHIASGHLLSRPKTGLAFAAIASSGVLQDRLILEMVTPDQEVYARFLCYVEMFMFMFCKCL